MRFKNSILKAAFVVALFAGIAHAGGNNFHSEIFVLTNSSITVTGSTTTWVGTSYGDFNSADFYISVTSVTGATPSLTPLIQVSPDDGVTWINSPTTWSAITVATSTAKTSVDIGGASMVRLQYNTSGTNPVFKTTTWLQVRKK